jgi:hypothetical protein
MADEFETVDQAVTAAAKGLVKKSTDPTGSIENYSLKELREEANHEASSVAATKSHRGLRFTRCIPPGTG